MVKTQKGKFPHVEWIDLYNEGVAYECAVMKRDGNGNISFIRIDQLDSIDRNRLARILRNRNATNYELWDLMSNVTLGNGVNALEYFHQMVRVITPSGKIIDPRSGKMGMAPAGRQVTSAPAKTETSSEE